MIRGDRHFGLMTMACRLLDASRGQWQALLPVPHGEPVERRMSLHFGHHRVESCAQDHLVRQCLSSAMQKRRRRAIRESFEGQLSRWDMQLMPYPCREGESWLLQRIPQVD